MINKLNNLFTSAWLLVSGKLDFPVPFNNIRTLYTVNIHITYVDLTQPSKSATPGSS
jgi:hypothetical protein